MTARSPSAIDLLAAYCSGKTSPVEAIEASLAAIKSDPTNSWVYVAEAESFS